MTDDLKNILTVAADKLKVEAYTAGWRDALAEVKKILGDLKVLADLIDSEPDVEAEDIELDGANGEIRFAPRSGSSNQAVNMPTQGTTPYYIVMAVRKKPGLTAGEIIAALREEGHSAPEGNIRTSIHRMKEKKLVVLRHGKWFPQ